MLRAEPDASRRILHHELSSRAMRIERTRTGSADRPDAEAATEGVAPTDLDVDAMASPPLQYAGDLQLWVVLARAFAAVSRKAVADIERYGLTPGDFAILEALYHHGPLLLGELQRKILVSSGGVTYLVDRLERQGYVERRNCPTDRRSRFAALTVDGDALMKQIFPQHAKAIADAVSGLSRREQRIATTLLRKLGLAAASVAADDVERVERSRADRR
jgi:MarR family transcriptional regulator, 2-MHQ and catechol-resistance regulon repressor